MSFFFSTCDCEAVCNEAEDCTGFTLLPTQSGQSGQLCIFNGHDCLVDPGAASPPPSGAGPDALLPKWIDILPTGTFMRKTPNANCTQIPS
ncbi:unnamed protein product [Polarella glacialis]|uniref:Uncharacterized protein n=1 Tax=Polarella glacialis TaxID=89957 RepID=A0A813FRH8_POLGL|nr:unnamed protein product [Polarella glacialis]